MGIHLTEEIIRLDILKAQISPLRLLRQFLIVHGFSLPSILIIAAYEWLRSHESKSLTLWQAQFCVEIPAMNPRHTVLSLERLDI